MLTPQEITEKVFVKAIFGGYDMTGVDDFLEAVAADYTALYKENAILKGKLKVLVEKVEEYRSTEDAMRMALLTAQRMGEEITVEANKAKEETLRTADMEVRAKLEDTAKRVADEEWRLSVAAKETAKFIELSQAIIRKHSEFLTKLETARRAVRPDPEPPAPTFEEHVADTAEQIGNAMERLAGLDTPLPEAARDPAYTEPADPRYAVAGAPGYNEATDPLPAYEDEGEPTRQYTINGDDDSVSPRPKFDFDDLKFGANFDKKKK